MKDRWQQSLEAAVAAYDTPSVWKRGTQRQALIARRKLEKAAKVAQRSIPQQRHA
ncbi:hypothetical protein [Yoonia sp. SS1-5]|uniref:Uncharacterized protein n=1 Tax=Yoonia rhodophyticola TaxID=3137370 RepID=A0AAN0MM75_9RHOB